jgi:hypothetical protein
MAHPSIIIYGSIQNPFLLCLIKSDSTLDRRILFLFYSRFLKGLRISIDPLLSFILPCLDHPLEGNGLQISMKTFPYIMEVNEYEDG